MALDPEEFARTFGAQVRARRKEAQMTQVEFSELIGMSDKTVRDIETGKLSPSLGTILEAAQALGIDLFSSAGPAVLISAQAASTGAINPTDVIAASPSVCIYPQSAQDMPHES